jgi:hypothetical protein
VVQAQRSSPQQQQQQQQQQDELAGLKQQQAALLELLGPIHFLLSWVVAPLLQGSGDSIQMQLHQQHSTTAAAGLHTATGAQV